MRQCPRRASSWPWAPAAAAGASSARAMPALAGWIKSFLWMCIFPAAPPTRTRCFRGFYWGLAGVSRTEKITQKSILRGEKIHEALDEQKFSAKLKYKFANAKKFFEIQKKFLNERGH